MQFQLLRICRDKNTVSLKKQETLVFSVKHAAALHTEQYLEAVASGPEFNKLPLPLRVQEHPFHLEISAAA